MAEAYPLAWPSGWPRTENRERNYHFKMTEGAMVEHLYGELDRLGATDIVVSSNMQVRLDGRPLSKQRMAEDPGVAVYFKLNGVQECIPCDKWDQTITNLHAVGLAIEAIRGMARWGTGTMVEAAFRGFAELPAAGETSESSIKSWYEVLQVSPDADEDIRLSAYRSLAKKLHPDNPATGDPTRFAQLQRAKEEAGI